MLFRPMSCRSVVIGEFGPSHMQPRRCMPSTNGQVVVPTVRMPYVRLTNFGPSPALISRESSQEVLHKSSKRGPD